jgi:predicted N-acetyltransferase YhbS
MVPSESDIAVGAPLAEAELSDADALVREAGWNQVAADWRIFMELGVVHAARNAAGRVIATAAILPYEARFAWISMVLVANEYRRRGLATRLMRRCLDELDADGVMAILDATPAGREVYRALGFQDVWSYRRLVRGTGHDEAPPIAAVEGVSVRPIGDEDWAALCAYDAAAFGANRGAVLRRLRGRLPAADLLAKREGRIVGFVLGRDGQGPKQLGPLVADDEETARALLAQGLAGIDASVYIDVADGKAGLHRWLGEIGFVPQRPLTRMYRGSSERLDDPAHTFGVAGPELG